MFLKPAARGYPIEASIWTVIGTLVKYTPEQPTGMLQKEADCTSRRIFDPAGLWLSSKAIAAYRFVVRFEFSRVIWRAWGMHRLPSDRSICSSSSSSPAARPQLRQACLSICGEDLLCPYSSDDTRTRHTWKAVVRVMLEFPMGKPRMPIVNHLRSKIYLCIEFHRILWYRRLVEGDAKVWSTAMKAF